MERRRGGCGAGPRRRARRADRRAIARAAARALRQPRRGARPAGAAARPARPQRRRVALASCERASTPHAPPRRERPCRRRAAVGAGAARRTLDLGRWGGRAHPAAVAGGEGGGRVGVAVPGGDRQEAASLSTQSALAAVDADLGQSGRDAAAARPHASPRAATLAHRRHQSDVGEHTEEDPMQSHSSRRAQFMSNGTPRAAPARLISFGAERWGRRGARRSTRRCAARRDWPRKSLYGMSGEPALR